MPNYAYSSLKFYGDEDIREKLCQFVKGENTEFCFSKIIPDTTGEYTMDWSIKNFGTKWNALNAVVQKEKNFVKITFTTAWYCPLPIFKKIIELFPKLDIDFVASDGQDKAYHIFHNDEKELIFNEFDKENNLVAIEAIFSALMDY
jgi:hypothetical protein